MLCTTKLLIAARSSRRKIAGRLHPCGDLRKSSLNAGDGSQADPSHERDQRHGLLERSEEQRVKLRQPADT